MSSIGRIVRRNHSAVFWCTRHYPKVKREAVYTLYALVKHFDDLSSSNLSQKDKKDILTAWQREISNIYDKKVPDTDIGRKIYKNCMRFKVARESLQNILDGFSMDCPNPIQRPSLKEFEKYCQGVAEIPSFLILKVIAEFDEETTLALSKAIGKAVEITNILKNVKEDMLNSHIYIPGEYLSQANIPSTLSPKEVLTHPNLYVARQKLANIARSSFAEAYRLLEENNNKNSKPIVYMLNLYNRYFELMDNRGWEIISPKPELKFNDRFMLIIKSLLFHGN
ncbi:MAG: squalene/phytoene synthase family protein [Alphaproteobacteria bacterium]|nr:squalene/phytoene synthase family protein [Alphaproteobacteria bacterium]